MKSIGLHATRITELEPDLIELSQHEVAPTPFITGDDLLTLGIQQGPKYRKILDAVYDAQLEGRITSKEAAIEVVRQSPQ